MQSHKSCFVRKRGEKQQNKKNKAVYLAVIAQSLRTYIVRGCDPIGLVMCMMEISVRTLKGLEIGPYFLFGSGDLNSPSFDQICKRKAINLQLCIASHFQKIPQYFRKRQPPKQLSQPPRAMLGPWFLPMPCWPSLSFTSFCLWPPHLLCCCPWKSIEL